MVSPVTLVMANDCEQSAVMVIFIDFIIKGKLRKVFKQKDETSITPNQ